MRRRHAKRRHGHPSAKPAFRASALCYAANCALGAAVATRLIDTRRFRWVHHALYIATFSATIVAVLVGLRRNRPAALALAPALAPLAVIPYAGTHTRRHPAIALTAAPFIAAGVITSRR
ncbi:hypothetical protein [Microbacterium sp. nov. GSS16]|uniref:hypothetical protein n=1 Tax=Microbacterium sp. nov. GSS16 TaxID=3019890 RepID=UPI0023068021|nr:hypothetical protein [Microbacterium sp. nov. GSS16]WCD93844.1 hypothetical protein PGB26_06055 [Microbacterium sp. nov. GSS16]